jgi:hypothetical protein
MDVTSGEFRRRTDSLREELDFRLDLDGALLSSAESDPELERERHELLAVHAALAASLVRPRPGFAAEVVRSLPSAPWEARTASAWRWPFVLLLALGGAAAALFGGAAAELEPVAPGFSAFATLAKLFSTAAHAGAGHAGATWKGLGVGLATWLVESKLHLLAAAILVAGLNLLLFRLLRPAARQSAGAAQDRSGRRGSRDSR